MRRLLACLMALMVVAAVSAQGLELYKNCGTRWGDDAPTMKEKPNGYIYRLRRDVQTTDLPLTAEVDGLELFIAERVPMGWFTLYRKSAGSSDYDFVVVIYNHDKKPIGVYNLCDIAQNRYCEVQDVRWDNDNRCILFNMACPSYASEINGKGSKLYSYNIDEEILRWQTPYLTSNDIFVQTDRYVFCAYGFTNEKDYLFMLDKKTGHIYSKIPMRKKVQYLETREYNGKLLLYVVDHDDNLFIYNVKNQVRQLRGAKGLR